VDVCKKSKHFFTFLEKLKVFNSWKNIENFKKYIFNKFPSLELNNSHKRLDISLIANENAKILEWKFSGACTLKIVLSDDTYLPPFSSFLTRKLIFFIESCTGAAYQSTLGLFFCFLLIINMMLLRFYSSSSSTCHSWWHFANFQIKHETSKDQDGSRWEIIFKDMQRKIFCLPRCDIVLIAMRQWKWKVLKLLKDSFCDCVWNVGKFLIEKLF
jgi:hypothetical protein